MRVSNRKPREPAPSPLSPGAGYSGGSAVTARIFTIEGTSEIQRMLIGRAVTGLDVR